MKMDKVILIILILLPFDMVSAKTERHPEQYWIDDESVRGWSKEKVFPIKQGDYIVAQASYALRYCNGELTHYMNIVDASISRNPSGAVVKEKAFENVKYICRYNGKPIKVIKMIFPPTPKGY